MTDTIKHKVAPTSKLPFIASMFTLFGTVLLCVMYWPIYVQYFSGGTFLGEPVSLLIVIFYAVLMLCTFFYSVFTGFVAKRTLVFSTIFALPIMLFFLLDVCGLRQTILFFDLDNVFWYYRNNPAYFSATWPFIVALVVLTVASIVSVCALTSTKVPRPTLHKCILGATAVVWFAFSLYRIIAADYLTYTAGAASARDFIYSILMYLTCVLFFVAQFLVALAIKRVDTLAQPIAQAETAAVPVPVGLPQYEQEPEAASVVIDVEAAPNPQPMPAVAEASAIEYDTEALNALEDAALASPQKPMPPASARHTAMNRFKNLFGKQEQPAEPAPVAVPEQLFEDLVDAQPVEVSEPEQPAAAAEPLDEETIVLVEEQADETIVSLLEPMSVPPATAEETAAVELTELADAELPAADEAETGVVAAVEDAVSEIPAAPKKKKTKSTKAKKAKNDSAVPAETAHAEDTADTPAES